MSLWARRPTGRRYHGMVDMRVQFPPGPCLSKKQWTGWVRRFMINKATLKDKRILKEAVKRLVNY